MTRGGVELKRRRPCKQRKQRVEVLATTCNTGRRNGGNEKANGTE